MNLIGLHFRIRRWFLSLFEPDETPGERLGRELREFLIKEGVI